VIVQQPNLVCVICVHQPEFWGLCRAFWRFSSLDFCRGPRVSLHFRRCLSAIIRQRPREDDLLRFRRCKSLFVAYLPAGEIVCLAAIGCSQWVLSLLPAVADHPNGPDGACGEVGRLRIATDAVANGTCWMKKGTATLSPRAPEAASYPTIAVLTSKSGTDATCKYTVGDDGTAPFSASLLNTPPELQPPLSGGQRRAAQPRLYRHPDGLLCRLYRGD
jgi:hypothetical protein